MNNTFDIKRFALLMKRDLVQDWKKYALQIAALLGSILAIFLFNSYLRYEDITHYKHLSITEQLNLMNETHIKIVTLLFVVASLLYASAMMTPISNKRKRIDYLMLPCSSFEKYLSRFVIHIIGFVAVFFICLFIADAIRMGIFSLAYPQFGVKPLELGILTNNVMFGDTMTFTILCTAFYSVVAFFTLGSTVWQKHVAIKNVVALIIINLLLVGFVALITKILTPEGGHLSMNVGPSDINEETAFMTTVAFFAALSIFFWVLSYFRFKETEIINKW